MRDESDRLNITLKFKLNTYQGNPNLFVNCDSHPPSSGNYEWNST